MIKIDAERCSGCGACAEICPTAAIYLVDERAAVDQGLCTECEACISVCPTEAISLVTSRDIALQPARMPAPRPEPQVIRVRTGSAPTSLRASVLPVVGGALVWAGRELVPRLAEYFLYDLDRRMATRQTSVGRQSTPDAGSSGRRGGGGRQRRRRRRGC